MISPDADQAGRKHAHQVAQSLEGKLASIKIVELAGLPPKGDVSDWLATGGTREQLEALAAAAPDFRTMEGTRPVLVRLADVEPEELRWVWRHRIASGKLALVIGDPGNAKALL